MKQLKRLNYDYGVIGEDTCVPNLKVGDIVSIIYNGEIITTIMVKNYGKSYLMGFALSFDTEWKFYNFKKIVNHSKINDDILEALGLGEYYLKDIEHKEMTIEEIEKELGYKVKIKSQ